MTCSHPTKHYDGDYTYQGRVVGRSWRCQQCGTHGMERVEENAQKKADMLVSEDLLMRLREAALI